MNYPENSKIFIRLVLKSLMCHMNSHRVIRAAHVGTTGLLAMAVSQDVEP